MFIGGLDVGTTGCKLTVYDTSGLYISNSYVEYDVARSNGEHEIDANIIFESVCTVIKEIVKDYDLAAIGITTFGESFVAVDKKDGVLFPTMLYTDPRGEEECAVLCSEVGMNRLISILGVKPSSMYSLPKIMWLKNHHPEVYQNIDKIMLIEDFIVYKLTGKAQIDYSLAARTMGFDIINKCWSAEVFDAAGVDVRLMSKLVSTGSIAGCILPEMAEKLGLSSKTKIINGCHDQVASAIGAGVFETGQAVDGTGTVECVTPVFNTIPNNEQLYEEGYAVVPYIFDGTYVCYAFSFTGGSALKWYRDNFAKYEARLVKNLKKNIFAVLDSHMPNEPTNLLVLPHFSGAATPYMDYRAKAAILGLTLEHTGLDIYRALIEGVTFEILLNLEHLARFGICPQNLYATGGGAASSAWLQIKADILNRPITALAAKEVGTCGTCMLTAAAIGTVVDMHEAKEKFVKYEQTYKPIEKNAKIYARHYEAYKQIYKAIKPIVEGLTYE